MNYGIPLELKLQEENWQVGWEFPPAGLLVFQHGTRFPAVNRLISMLLMKPADTRLSRGSGGLSWSRGSSS